MLQIALPGGEAFTPLPAAAAVAVACAVALFGPRRAPRPALAVLSRWIDVVIGVLVVVIVVRVLVARNERLVQRLVDQARIDPLTGLLNRRGFEERLSVELARAIRDGSSLAVVAFDLDRCKDVNDEHGHEVGDRVLTWVGAVLSEQLRGVDVAARIGGEEFVVALPRTDAAEASRVAERVRAAVADPQQRRARFGIGDALRVSVSGGVAARVAPVDLQAMLNDADRALYAAKRAGRHQIVVHEGSVPATA